eukprot:1494300-Pleurochrysis_carterae.AAC.1
MQQPAHASQSFNVRNSFLRLSELQPVRNSLRLFPDAHDFSAQFLKGQGLILYYLPPIQVCLARSALTLKP